MTEITPINHAVAVNYVYSAIRQRTISAAVVDVKFVLL
jgi:hypothetical protein